MSFTIFNSRRKKRVILEEGEPPPKKNGTEAETLIKHLAEKQLDTKITLKDQLLYNKDFQHGEEYNTFLTKSYAGSNNLNEFQLYIDNLNAKNDIKRRTVLSSEDIDFYHEYKNSKDLDGFLKTHKNIERTVLEQRLKSIEDIIETCSGNAESNSSNFTTNKPESTETKLLQFALQNQFVSKEEPKLPHPMDEIVDIEKEFTKNSELFSDTNCNVNKIQKRARNIANRINKLEESSSLLPEPKKLLNKTNPNSLWDVKVSVDSKNSYKIKQKIIDKDKKIYTCEKQNLYTIENGHIVKISHKSEQQDRLDIPNSPHKEKLTVEDIKNIPKFSKYEPGVPTEVLYVKNLPSNLNKETLEKSLESFLEHKEVSIKVMCGKMKGQAFIKFKSIEDSTETLNQINGLLIKNRPMIVQFGHKKIQD